MYKHCPFIVAVTGFAILVIGIACTWYGFPALLEWQISKNINLENGTDAFKMWAKQPFPLLFKVYIFNVTNPEEAMNGSPPILKELGPYVYDLEIEREISAVDDDADTIEYYLKKRFYFNSKESGCRSDNDKVTIINAALMGMLLKVNMIAPQMLQLVNDGYHYMYPDAKDMFLTVQVKDLLFSGITLYCSAPEISTMCMAMKFALPVTMKRAQNNQDFIFSIFGKFNETAFGPLVMTRGLKNTTRGSLISYNGDHLLDNWARDSCNMINGSDSGLFSTMKTPVDKVYSFTPEICRSIGITFETTLEKRNFIAYKYSTTEESLSHKGSNICFCDEYDGEFECPLDGLQDLNSCLRAPVLMSNPHFYLGDETLLNYAVGLKPQKKLHESFVTIEPITATPIEGAKRTQMNVEVKRFDLFPLLANMTEGVFPILWLEEGVSLPNDLLTRLEDSFRGIIALDIIKWILIACGIGFMIIAFFMIMYQEKLMCFASSGTLPINNNKIVVSHIKAFNSSSVVHPQADDKQNNVVNDAWSYKN